MIDSQQWLEENPLTEHELVQGTPEWLAFRLEHDGASEAAVMLGISNLATRTELLDAKSTGIAKEFSDWVQANILDYGHEVEALARPIVAQQFGLRLFPLICSRGRLSASCDGLTMDGTIGWEHKQWNATLAAAVAHKELPDTHMPQVQQALLVTGAEKWIFTVSDGTLENMVSMEVLPYPAWFERIRAGWAQFNKDRETHVPKVIAEKPKAEVTIDLPALFVHAKGEITEHNMEAFGVALTNKLAEVRAIQLVTDQDFSNAKEAAKKFRETAKEITLSEAAMLAQTETIGEASRKMKAWVKDLNATALQLEKDVEREDLAKKRVMVCDTAALYAAHIEALESETRPIRLNVPTPVFTEAIKNKRNYASMQGSLDDMLAQGKIAADAAAKDVREKLVIYSGTAACGYEFLFRDLQTLITKPKEDFELVISTRVKTYIDGENAKREAERARMQQEEEAKARAKVEAEQAEARAKAEAESKEIARFNQQQIDAKVANEAAAAKIVTAQPAQAVPAPTGGQPQETGAVTTSNVVVMHQDAISAFLASRDFGKEAGKVRAVLVEYVKFEAQFGMKVAA